MARVELQGPLGQDASLPAAGAPRNGSSTGTTAIRITDDESVRDPKRPNLRTVSNTAPIAHGGKLFTLKEDGLPHQIDPATLDTIGPWDFNGAWKSETFTAHPKIDPVTGEMVAFGYEATGLASDDVFIYTIDKTGKVTREVRIKVPYVSVIHDMALTQKHIMLPFGGYVTSVERLEGRQGPLGLGPDEAEHDRRASARRRARRTCAGSRVPSAA